MSPPCREEGCSRFYAAFHFSGAPSGEIPLKRIKRRTEPTYEFVYGAILGDVVYTKVTGFKKQYTNLTFYNVLRVESIYI